MSTTAERPRLNVIVASTRPGRAGAAIGDWFHRAAVDHGGFDVRLVDLAELALPFLDEPVAAIESRIYAGVHTHAWSATTAAADAFVLVTPEYNRGYPASLKNALDFLYHEWVDKPVAIVSYGMSSGGLRAAQALMPVVTALRMIPLSDVLPVRLRDVTDADGTIRPTAALADEAKDLLTELARVTEATAGLRAAA